MRCKICESAKNIGLETRDGAPVAQNLIFQSREEALNCPAGRLDMRRCQGCGFVWNAAYDPDMLVYDANYDNDQNFSPRFRAHTDEVARRIVERSPSHKPLNIVEVGCGQGKFLGILAREFGSRLNLAIGFDPAWKGEADNLAPCCEVRGEYFSSDSVRENDPQPDLLFSRHVIEHVPDPIAFLKTIRASLPSGIPVFIETPDVDWILRNGVFFDFYYEHCSLFTRGSLRLALEQAGFIVEKVTPIFDEQYLFAAATTGAAAEGETAGPECDDLGYRESRSRFMASLTQMIAQARAAGPVALWGGASKGVTICLTLPDSNELLSCVIDINQRKQGCFLPCSGIQIVSPKEAARLGVKVAIVVNPAYLAETRELCARDAIDLQLIPLDGEN